MKNRATLCGTAVINFWDLLRYDTLLRKSFHTDESSSSQLYQFSAQRKQHESGKEAANAFLLGNVMDIKWWHTDVVKEVSTLQWSGLRQRSASCRNSRRIDMVLLEESWCMTYQNSRFEYLKWLWSHMQKNNYKKEFVCMWREQTWHALLVFYSVQSVVHYTKLSQKTLSLYFTYFEGILPQRAERTKNECTFSIFFYFAWVVPLGIRPLSLVLFAMYSAYWCMQNHTDINRFTFESWLITVMMHSAERKNQT